MATANNPLGGKWIIRGALEKITCGPARTTKAEGCLAMKLKAQM